MKLSWRRALVAAVALAAPVAARAQPDTTWWICAEEITVSTGVAAAGGLLPGLKRVQNDTIYTSIFQTSRSEIGQADTYARLFHNHLVQTGQVTVDAMLRCVPETEVKVRELRAALTQDRYIGYKGAGGITVRSTVIDVDWKPDSPRATVAASGAIQVLDAKVEDLTPQAGKLIGLSGGGALIASVGPGGAAAKAGLAELDVITEISGHPVTSAAELADVAGKLRVGFNAPIRVWRDKAMVDLTVTIPPPVQPPPAAATASAEPEKSPALRLGMVYGAAFEDLRKIVSDIPTSGALVFRVFPGGPADLAGLKPLDVIVSLRESPIENREGLKAAVVALPDGPSTMKVWRSGVLRDLTIDLGKDRKWPYPVDPGPFDPVAPRPGVCMNRAQNLAGKDLVAKRSEIWPVDRPEDDTARQAELAQFLTVVRTLDPTFPTKPQKLTCAAREGVRFCATFDKGGYFAGVFCGNDLARLISKYTPDGDRLVAWRPARP